MTQVLYYFLCAVDLFFTTLIKLSKIRSQIHSLGYKYHIGGVRKVLEVQNKNEAK